MAQGGGNDELQTGEDLRIRRGPGPRTRSAWTPLSRTLAATGDRWTLVIALALAPGRMRLSRLHSHLPGISAGVLERHLQQMVALGLVSRTRFREMPPRVELELTRAGRELLPIAHALTRWGVRHLWSPPREREHVDLDALLRLLPALLEEDAGLPEGSVEAVVVGAQPTVRVVYQTDEGHLWLVDHAENPTTAGLAGDEDAWVAALGPMCDYERLRITGDERLARRILEGLPRPG